MAAPKSKEWSRALLCRPKDNLKTEAGERALRHVMLTSLDTEKVPDTMSMLISMEYARIWLQDREKFRKKVDRSSKVIKNDIDWWLKLRKTNKCFCSI